MAFRRTISGWQRRYGKARDEMDNSPFSRVSSFFGCPDESKEARHQNTLSLYYLCSFHIMLPVHSPIRHFFVQPGRPQPSPSLPPSSSHQVVSWPEVEEAGWADWRRLQKAHNYPSSIIDTSWYRHRLSLSRPLHTRNESYISPYTTHAYMDTLLLPSTLTPVVCRSTTDT